MLTNPDRYEHAIHIAKDLVRITIDHSKKRGVTYLVDKSDLADEYAQLQIHVNGEMSRYNFLLFSVAKYRCFVTVGIAENIFVVYLC